MRRFRIVYRYRTQEPIPDASCFTTSIYLRCSASQRAVRIAGLITEELTGAIQDNKIFVSLKIKSKVCHSVQDDLNKIEV